jgi:hypothetical protein
MKRALIAGLGVLALIVGVQAANAQANINPNLYPGNTSERYGATAPWEWQATPGPIRRGRPLSEPGHGSLTAVTERSSRSDDRRRVADFYWRRLNPRRQLFANTAGTS